MPSQTKQKMKYEVKPESCCEYRQRSQTAQQPRDPTLPMSVRFHGSNCRSRTAIFQLADEIRRCRKHALFVRLC
jgi:hypothetical protein